MLTEGFQDGHLGLGLLAVQRGDFEEQVGCFVWVGHVHLERSKDE